MNEIGNFKEGVFLDKVMTQDLIDAFKLKLVSGGAGVARQILTSDLSRPGLELAGYFEYYPEERLQLLGKTELTFFEKLTEKEKSLRMERLCTEATPAIIITRNLDVPPELIVASERNGVPVVQSHMQTTRLSSRITNYLEGRLAPMIAVHGVLVDIYGVGVLITGKSGVGKSEAALELVKRGHRLVADDSVEIRQEDENTLIGNPPEMIKHLLEIRGLGIINVMTLFGAGAIRNFKQITMVIDLEIWDDDKEYDRLGLDEERRKYIDTQLPLLTIPVRPGRNLAIIIEVAAMNFRLKQMGLDAAEQFEQKLTNVLNKKDRKF